ncbi:hypothetical protein Bca52824_015587 [Brassica carinata]|uniref:Uncharacterized protein n=1 Tax=Brassica carinata TaxID=52824 RepID=A0A8X8B3B5_BRACI|nr:hypothetical protein Bca52824_015587 [Brassica carinata]
MAELDQASEASKAGKTGVDTSRRRSDESPLTTTADLHTGQEQTHDCRPDMKSKPYTRLHAPPTLQSTKRKRASERRLHTDLASPELDRRRRTTMLSKGNEDSSFGGDDYEKEIGVLLAEQQRRQEEADDWCVAG